MINKSLFILIFSQLAIHSISGQVNNSRQLSDSIAGLMNAGTNIINKRSASLTNKAASIVQKKDSVLQNLQALPGKYFTGLQKKIDKYSGRISGKTEKTLEKLSRWENKIKSSLEKVNPGTAQKLFGNNQLTFALMLQKLKNGEDISRQYSKQYDAHLDKLTGGLKYLEQQKDKLNEQLVKPLEKTKENMDSLSVTISNAEVIKQLIRERKKQLMDGALSYIGKSRYLSKISKETWYYAESLKNYKDLFDDQEKAEQMAQKALEQIPGFNDFIKKNSALSKVFSPGATGQLPQSGSSMPVVNGLPNRQAFQDFVTASLPSIADKAGRQVQLPNIQGELNKWQQKVNEKGGMGDKEMPDFKPNSQRSKLFKQRLEFGGDMQFKSSNNVLPAAATLSLKAGYKINDKNTAGFGIAYSLGLGEGWNKIKFSHEGVGIRTYYRFKIKKFFDLQGGAEWNHLQFKNISDLQNENSWQQSALLGINKSYSVSKKAKGSVQVLYDFLYNKHIPASQPVLFRIGYDLK